MKTAILSSTRKVRIGLEHVQSPIHWELSLYYLTNKLRGKVLFIQIIIWHDSAFTQWEKSYPWELLFKILNNSWLIWQLTERSRSIVNSLRHKMYFRPTQHNEKKNHDKILSVACITYIPNIRWSSSTQYLGLCIYLGLRSLQRQWRWSEFIRD